MPSQWGDLVLVVGGLTLTCGQVLRCNVDADSLVAHELGGVDLDLARRAFAPKYHDPVPGDTAFASGQRDTYESHISMRHQLDIVLPLFSLTSDGTPPRSVVHSMCACEWRRGRRASFRALNSPPSATSLWFVAIQS